MPVRVRCPGCESLYRLADHLAGKTVRCKSCGGTFKVPIATEEPAQEAAADEPTVKPAKAAAKVRKPAPDEDVEDRPAKGKRRSTETDEEPAEPPKRGKSKKASAGRKGMPVMLLAGVLVGVIVIIGGCAAVYFMFFSGPTKPASSQAKAKPLVPPKQPGGGAKGPGKGEMDPGNEQPDAGNAEAKDDPEKELVLPGDGPVSFVSHVKPFLNRYCVKCHSGKMPKAGIALTSYDGIIKAKKKQTLVFPGVPDKSLMVQVVEHKVKHSMPPDKEKQPTDEEKGILRKWVTEGAKDDSIKAGALRLPLQRLLVEIQRINVVVCLIHFDQFGISTYRGDVMETARAATLLKGIHDHPAALGAVVGTADEHGLAVLAEFEFLQALGGVNGAENELGSLIVGMRRQPKAAGVLDSSFDQFAGRLWG